MGVLVLLVVAVGQFLLQSVAFSVEVTQLLVPEVIKLIEFIIQGVGEFVLFLPMLGM